MQKPEREPPVSMSLPIRFEYKGNFSNQITLNSDILSQLVQIIGTPKTVLVFKDGNERIERTGIVVTGFRGPFQIKTKQTPDRKAFWETNINEEKKEFDIFINSHVIDGRIREFCPVEDYEKIFLQTLQGIILIGIEKWAFYEAEEKGIGNVFKNMKKEAAITIFLLKNQSRIILLDKKPKSPS